MMIDNKKACVFAAVRSGMGLVRHNNEDAYYFNGAFAPLQKMDAETSLSDEFPLGGTLFAVCDGMGGAQNGELASNLAVSRMHGLADAIHGHSFSDALREWVSETNLAVTQATHGGGCTLALVYVDADCVRIAHIGDSRVYRLHDGALTPLTRDHSKVQMLIDVGLLTPEQARTHPHRHMITRYLGMNEEEAGTCSASVDHPMPLMNGDRYLICSDGVTDMLDDERLESLMAGAQSADACADAVYRAALEAGGADNTTLIVLEICAPDSVDFVSNSSDQTQDADWLDKTENPESAEVPECGAASGTMRIVHEYDWPHSNRGRITVTTEVFGIPNAGVGKRLHMKTRISGR